MLIITKELECRNDRDGQTACIVTDGTSYWVVSSLVAAFDTGLPETLVFPATAEGRITDYCEIAGGRWVTREEAIDELEGVLCSSKVS